MAHPTRPDSDSVESTETTSESSRLARLFAMTGEDETSDDDW
jgi:hypothetical protein